MSLVHKFASPAEPNGDLARKVGLTIRELRWQRGLTLNQVAELCQTTGQTIQRLEMATMKLSVDWIEKICNVLDVAPYQLFAADALLQSQLALMKAVTELETLKAAFSHFTEIVNAVRHEQLD